VYCTGILGLKKGTDATVSIKKQCYAIMRRLNGLYATLGINESYGILRKMKGLYAIVIIKTSSYAVMRRLK
jgi:hypothetical protein